MAEMIPVERIQTRIHVIRDAKVMLDLDPAELYGVTTAQLKRQVRRNPERFPRDFMFVVSREEYNSLRCQIGTLKRGQHAKYLPMAFTEYGVAMLSSVLNSKRAIQVNIRIMRAFALLHEMSKNYRVLARKIEAMERKYDHRFKVVFDAIKQLIAPTIRKKVRIGF